PARERGSKHPDKSSVEPNRVAPRAGARIETRSRASTRCSTSRSLPARERGSKHVGGAEYAAAFRVAPRAGARIETFHLRHRRRRTDVAPRAGARIETA